MKPAAVLLAGGAGSRMGGQVPKPLVDLGGRSLAEHVLERLSPHCEPILVSAPDPGPFARLARPVVPDLRKGRAGPLAGLEAAFDWLRRRPLPPTQLVCVPGDTPFLPSDLVARLASGGGARVALATSLGRRHPTVSLWPMAVLSRLSAYLDEPAAKGSFVEFLSREGFDEIDFEPSPQAPDGDPFFNVNTPQDLERARRPRD